MNSIFQKLNIKYENKILVLNIPQEFKNMFNRALKEGAKIDEKRMPSSIYTFALVFVTSIDEISVTASMSVKSLVKENPKFWIAFPKSNSRKYKTDIKKDADWEVMNAIGFRVDKSTEINEDWIAYRFTRLNKVSVE
ncbi:MAG: hypothetical protein PVI26_07540 [Chitinispirillia bacterium]|jgi:molybdopterin-biosynthesis enzyme MoeA-like protein